MINTKELLLTQLIQKQELLNQEQLDSFRQGISNYAYPIGLIPQDIFNTKIFIEDELSHILNYIENLFTQLFNTYYSEEEISILTTYFSFNVTTSTILNKIYIDRIVPLLSKHNEKKEIQYVIDELKYRYLQHLLYSNSNDPQINILIEELSLIEEEHNKFILRQRTK